jgi:hypothetical protein
MKGSTKDMTTSINRGFFSPLRAVHGAGEARQERLSLRLDEDEVYELDRLAERYAAAKGMKKPPLRTILVRIALQRLAKAFPAPKQA